MRADPSGEPLESLQDEYPESGGGFDPSPQATAGLSDPLAAVVRRGTLLPGYVVANSFKTNAGLPRLAALAADEHLDRGDPAGVLAGRLPALDPQLAVRGGVLGGVVVVVGDPPPVSPRLSELKSNTRS